MDNFNQLIGRGYTKQFEVTVSSSDGTYSRSAFSGQASLHVSGALLVEGDDGRNVIFGSGQWEKLSYEAPAPKTASVPRTI